jgi:hypothetical protein
MDDEGDLITLESIADMEEALHVCGCKLRLDVDTKTPLPSSPAVRRFRSSPILHARRVTFIQPRK